MGWLVLGLLLGLAVGAAAVAAVVRAVGRTTGTTPRTVGLLILEGLHPGAREDGVAVERALARRLKRAAGRTAAGRAVAADLLTVHVSPEDHALIDASLGVEAAEADLAAFYLEHATSGGWIVGAEPRVRLVRDISLRPRQAYVRTETHAAARAESSAGRPAAPEGRPATPEARPPVAVRRDDATTDVLPRADVEQTAATAVYPGGLLLGDLVAVHGTDVRRIPAALGALRIGRGRHNDLVLDAPGVGRDHLVVEVRGDGWWIVPGTSEAATMLDGHALGAAVPLTDPVTLDLGRGARIRLSVVPAFTP